LICNYFWRKQAGKEEEVHEKLQKQVKPFCCTSKSFTVMGTAG